jgi:threonine/homoserine efflux transporter RhtA
VQLFADVEGAIAVAQGDGGQVHVTVNSNAVIAITRDDFGIKYTGATTAAILSTFEPITSVICGALFLGEKLSFYNLIGCGCIVASVILVATAGKRKPAETR